MLPDTPSVSQLSHVILQATAPAFLLGAIAAFIAILISRLNRIIDRTIVLNGIPDDDRVKSRLRTDLPRLLRRTAMLNRAIFWAVLSSIIITILVIVAFASAFFHIEHEHGVAILFVASLGAFGAALVDFAREVRIALSDLDHFKRYRCEGVRSIWIDWVTEAAGAELSTTRPQRQNRLLTKKCPRSHAKHASGVSGPGGTLLDRPLEDRMPGPVLDRPGQIILGRRFAPLIHLETGQQTDVTWRPTDALLSDAARFAWRGEFGPPVSELLPGLSFVADTAL